MSDHPALTHQPSAHAPYNLDDLLYLMARLRKPQTGCPWDLKQSYATIVPSTLEEAYEVADAIAREDFAHLPEELGDLLFQTIFYSQLASEEGRFDFHAIVSGLVEKLVRRHPHVFPDGTLASEASPSTPEQEASIKQRWESIKQQEREAKGASGVLDDVPIGLPALVRAQKLQKRAANVGFDWSSLEGVQAKILEELGEFTEALHHNDADAIRGELGDLFFTLVNLARHLKIDAESALREANQKFYRRFTYVERKLADQGVAMQDASSQQMDLFWEEAKAAE